MRHTLRRITATFLVGIVLALMVTRAEAADLGAVRSAQTSAVAVDSTGRLHAVWIEPVGSGSGLFYHVIDSLAAASNQRAHLIAQSNHRMRRPQLAVDSVGNIHLVWQERFAKSAGARAAEGTWVHYARLHAQRVEGDNRLYHAILNERPQALHPDLAVDPSGGAIVVWEEKAGRLLLAKVNSEGAIASRQFALNGQADQSTAFPAVAADQDGQIHLAWSENSAGKSRMLYALIDSETLAAVGQSHVVQTLPTEKAQRKSLSVASSDQLRLTWSFKNEKGAFGETPVDSNYIVLAFEGRLGSVTVGGVVDSHVRAADTARPPLEFAAVAVKTPSLLVATVGMSFSYPDSAGRLSGRTSADFEQFLRREILEHSTQSGAPPSAGAIRTSAPPLASDSYDLRSPYTSKNSSSAHDLFYRFVRSAPRSVDARVWYHSAHHSDLIG